MLSPLTELRCCRFPFQTYVDDSLCVLRRISYLVLYNSEAIPRQESSVSMFQSFHVVALTTKFINSI